METLLEKPASLPQVARELIRLIGEDTQRPGLKKTPERFAKALAELTSGYSMDLDTLINGAIYPAPARKGMVLVQGIRFHSLCEHHMLPFSGLAHVAYLPQERIVGLSKIPRIVNMYSRRLQLQEQLTDQIAQALESTLAPQGVAVMIAAQHACLQMRGAKAGGSEMVTTTYLGRFDTCGATRNEFLNLITQKGY
ncbi:MAG: GTP cyclohydrolase I FolE [Elusimicrobiota bacterium]